MARAPQPHPGVPTPSSDPEPNELYARINQLLPCVPRKLPSAALLPLSLHLSSSRDLSFSCTDCYRISSVLLSATQSSYNDATHCHLLVSPLRRGPHKMGPLALASGSTILKLTKPQAQPFQDLSFAFLLWSAFSLYTPFEICIVDPWHRSFVHNE